MNDLELSNLDLYEFDPFGEHCNTTKGEKIEDPKHPIKPTRKPFTYFEVLQSVVNKREIPDEDVLRLYNGFLTIKYLGANIQACHQSNFINSCRGNLRVPKLAEYKALKNIITVPKNTYIKFDSGAKLSHEINLILQEHFHINSQLATVYAKALGFREVLKIVEKTARISQDINQLKGEIRERVINRRNTYKSLIKKIEGK